MNRRTAALATVIAAAACTTTFALFATGATAGTGYWTHPEDEYGDPTADIRAYSIALDMNTFRVTVVLGEFDLASAQSSTYNVELDTDGDGVADFNIGKENAATAAVYEGERFNASEPLPCPSAAVAYNEAAKSVTLSASVDCIGGPASLRGYFYYSVAEGGDFAPAIDRFSPAVSSEPSSTPSASATSTPSTSPTASSTPSRTAAPSSTPTRTAAPSGSRTTARLAGADRYTTAVAVSRAQFLNGADTVYIARADAFADALAGGVLTEGPILLVPQCGTVPAPVLNEVRRLGATHVVALGGPSAVCDAVHRAVAAA